MSVLILILILSFACSTLPSVIEGAPPATEPSGDTAPADSGKTDDTGESDELPGEGLIGGWSIQHSDAVSGARFIHPINTDKDGSIVAARLASALGGLGVAATSDAREATLSPTRLSDATMVDEIADFIVGDLYSNLAHAGEADQPLLVSDTLVLTSVHRYGLYVAEALHAPLLPLQFISFADDWDQVTAASTRATIIVGQDYDYSGLWLWNKLGAGEPGSPSASLPPAYIEAISAAERLVIVQPDDSWTACTEDACWDAVHQVYTGGESPIYLHTSLTLSAAVNVGTQRYAEAADAGLLQAAPLSAVTNLKQWEWGVADSAVANIRALWLAQGKPSEDLTVMRGGVVDMFAWTPHLWRAYLAENGQSPRGMNVSSYWVASPQLERCGAVLPFPSYTWWSGGWHPLDDSARALLSEACGAECSAPFAENSRALINTIGSASDPERIADLMGDLGLTAQRGTYFGSGINAQGAADWTGWTGEVILPAWEVVAMDIQDPERCPLTEADWHPMTVEAICVLRPGACE